MADPERTLALARGGLENWIRGDREAVIETLADDVEVYVPPELGNAGTYRGREQFVKWVAEWDEAWAEYEMELGEVEAVGERHVVAHVISRAKGHLSGIEVGNELGWVLGVREDDRMDYLALLPDLEQARRNALEREAG